MCSLRKEALFSLKDEQLQSCIANFLSKNIARRTTEAQERYFLTGVYQVTSQVVNHIEQPRFDLRHFV